MIVFNPALDLLLQDKRNECERRNSVGSHRVSAFALPVFLATHIAIWLIIYSHVLKKRRDEKLRDTMERRQELQVSSLISISSQS